LRLVGLAAIDPAVTPVPDNTMLSDGLEAVLAMARLPFTLPLEFGAKVAVRIAL